MSDEETPYYRLNDTEDLEVSGEPLLSEVEEEPPCRDRSGEDTREASTVRSWRGPLLLVLVSFLFSTLNVSLRGVYARPDPPTSSVVSAVRGWLAVVFFVPLLVFSRPSPQQAVQQQDGPEQHSPIRPLWLAAAELAFWNFSSQALFNLGLVTTPSAKASFLGQTSVVLVPLITLWRGEQVPSMAMVGCFLSLVGLVILSYDDPTAKDKLSLGVGELQILAGTLCWSVYMIRMSALASSYSNLYLQGTKTFFMALLYSIWLQTSLWRFGTCVWLGWKDLIAWGILAYSAAGPGTMADLLQQEAQAMVSATESNLILSMEPAFTTILAYVVLSEGLRWLECVGGVFLVLGAFVATQKST